MHILYSFISILCHSGRTLFVKKAGQKSNNMTALLINNSVLSLITLIIIILSSFYAECSLSRYTIICASMYALSCIISQITYIKLISEGAVSIGALFSSSGFIIPSIAGPFIWHESIKLTQIIAMIILLISIYLMTRGENEQITKKKLFNAILCLFTMGTNGVIQKIHQTSPYANELSGFLICSFILLTFISFLLVAILIKQNHIKSETKFSGNSILFMTFAGLCNGIVNRINLYLTGVIPSVLLFPILNGGTIVFSTIGAYIFFKEKLQLKQCISIILGIISMILIVQ